MILEVKKGSHRFRPSWPWLVLRKHMSYTVTFLPSCRYDIGPDQEDWNKLFGVGFFPHHHRNSYRFGWRYNIDTDMIEIGAYWYINGKRNSKLITTCKINNPCRLSIYHVGRLVYYVVDGITDMWHVGKWPLIGYKLGAYFGGNQSAPHDMKIGCMKLK